MTNTGCTNETAKGNNETYVSQASGALFLFYYCGFSLYATRINQYCLIVYCSIAVYLYAYICINSSVARIYQLANAARDKIKKKIERSSIARQALSADPKTRFGPERATQKILFVLFSLQLLAARFFLLYMQNTLSLFHNMIVAKKKKNDRADRPHAYRP